ncbi:MAG: GTP 3',8-cyclase MoaA [Acidimicrobiales bacterium]
MVASPLVDPYGRTVRDLRISITDRCNFRCTYCMPEEGMTWLAREELLSFEEIERVARVCVERFDFDGIRLTGGEPTVRAHLPVLVGMLSRLVVPSTGRPVDLAMTTNGATLRLVAADLRAAGLNRLNISCDSLRRDRFMAMARRDQLPRVLDGIDAALEAGFDPVKVNVVMVRGVNDDEAVDFATFGRERGVQPRFIEFMPLDADGAWTRDQVVPAEETIAAIAAVYPIEPVTHGPEPATRWRYLDGRGEFGVIPSVTRPFCDHCDRVRITAEGQFRTCLFAVDEHDLRAVLRSGGSDEELALAVRAAVGTKWAGHRIGQVNFIRPARSMSQIGG